MLSPSTCELEVISGVVMIQGGGTPFSPGALDPANWDGMSLHTNAILEGADLALEGLS